MMKRGHSGFSIAAATVLGPGARALGALWGWGKNQNVPVSVFVSLVLCLGAVSAPVPGAEALAPGPLAVRLVTVAEDGKPTPVPHAYVSLGGRRASTDEAGVATVDGLPAGRHALAITQSGYEAVSQSVDVPPGPRTALEVRLTPVTRVYWGGRVLTEGLDRPLAGVAVSLRPLQVRAALAGPAAAVSDWEGAFEFAALAPGRYELLAEAPGFLPVTRQVEVRKDAPLELRLAPEATAARLEVAAADALTGKALAGAAVRVGETLPAGLVAEGRTGADGVARFDALRVGPANLAGADDRVAVSRRRVAVRVEAPGYEPGTVPATLAEGGEPLRVALSPLEPQREAEPNDALATAQEIRTGAPVTLTVARNGDHDFFRFRLSHPGRLVVTVGAEGPLATHLRVRDGEGKLLQEQGARAGQENRIERWVGAGTFYVELSQWGDNASDPEKTLTLTVSREYAVDPREPNDTVDAAVPARLGEELSGVVWPVGDHDVYRLDLPRPGQLRVRDRPVPFERHARLRNGDGGLVVEQGAHADRPLDFSADVPAGAYLVEIGEWGDNGASLTPYRLRVDFLPDDGTDDAPPAPGKMASVRTLPLAGAVGATLLPRGDIDVYTVALPNAGTLRLESDGRLERHVQVFDRTGRLLVEQGAHAERPNALAWSVEGPETLYVAIREWGDNNASASAYSLRAWFEPADELDAAQRNDRFETAVPLLPGETVRGTYLPVRDLDVFALDLDFPGHLRVRAQSGHETHLRVFDASRALVQEVGAHAGKAAELRPQVNAGRYYVMLSEWGENSSSPEPYELTVQLERAEPAERWPLAADPPRRLADGEAQAYTIDHVGDRDRFLFDMPAAGTVTLSVAGPMEVHVRVYDDRTGAMLFEHGVHAPARWSRPVEVQGPTRLRVELSEWGENNKSDQPHFVMADTRGRAIQADAVTSGANAASPQTVTFQKTRLDYAAAPASCEVNLGGEAKAVVRLEGGKPVQARFPRQGLYRVEARCTGSEGQSARQSLWVQATGAREREGIALFLNAPGEGQVLDGPVEAGVIAISYSGRPVSRVEFRLDGTPAGTDYATPYQADVPWARLGPGPHEIKVTAFDAAGAKAELKRTFQVSEYFGLSPPDGAVLSGQDVRVGWSSFGFGETRVRFRKAGTEAWTEVVGESGRARTVVLTGLEAGVPYEFQPLGGKESGPVRTVTRVKGLAFGKSRYGANIRRDYDQRVGVSVRNNGEAPLSVRLECGKPHDPLMLVGFVGDGSEDRPFNLGPGEVREFMLGISAQDVDTADHVVPIRIVSADGLSDEAEVAVHVQLPHVELAWEDVGPARVGPGRVFRLRNLGDAVTDLAVTAADPHAVTLSPTVRHGLLPEHGSMDFTVTPHFYEGFTGVSTRLVARGLDRAFEHAYEFKLGAGESAREVWLFPGRDPADAAARDGEAELVRRARQAERLDAATVDWGRRQGGEDLDGDGRLDRWTQRVGDVEWVGDDSDADGEVDFAHADVGADGIFEYSAYREGDRWRATNLVEAWLEMGFSLPYGRSEYKQHDADVVVNGVVVGRLRDVIPEGNYTFRIPPSALRFDDSGLPGDNRVGIRSKHLRGGHYVVNSDFRFKFRLTATPMWTVAKSEDEARKSVAAIGGVTSVAPDLSVSSSDLKVHAPAEPKAGDEVAVEVALRNLGSVSPATAEVALFRSQGSGPREEIARVPAGAVPLHGSALVRIPWQARGGQNTLTVVADPDDVLKDLDRANNEAVFFMQVTGDNTPPTLKVARPKAGEELKDPLVTLDLEVGDDAGPVTPAVSVDGGLWQKLPPATGRVTADLLLQPGDHRVDLRVTDASGNVASEKLALKVTAPAPEARIVSPAPGAEVSSPSVPVEVVGPADLALVGARTAGGPWRKAPLVGNGGRVELPLRFGPQTVEVLVANQRGVVRVLTVDVRRTTQPTEAEKRQANLVADQGLLWPVNRPELEVDLFKAPSALLSRLSMPPGDLAQRLRDDARRRQASGDYAGALVKYRESLNLAPDPQIRDRVKKLESYLRVDAGGVPAPAPAPKRAGGQEKAR